MILGFDFESTYSTEFSLTRMDPASYILDPRFETIGCAFKENDKPSIYVDGPDIPAYLAKFDPDHTTTYAFNALFDNCILGWRYGFFPARMYCTMRLAVALRGHLLNSGNSLKAVAVALGVGEKGTAIADAKGLRREDIVNNAEFYKKYQEYAINDNELNAAIFYKLIPELPPSERRVMDKVLRCAVEPKFQVDVEMLRTHIAELETAKQEMLDKAGCDRNEVLSSVKFSNMLKELGVEIEYKPSHTTPGAKIPALAKTDKFMEDLQNHEDVRVQALAAARLGLKSTIEQTRSARILNIAELDWSNYHDGNWVPVPLVYSGAHTHRLSGDWKLNMQNLPSGRGGKSKLRHALIAPPGHKVVVADKSQIECRITAYICGQRDLLDMFRDKKDPYAALASKIFNTPVDKNTEKGLYRFIGKTGVLGLGYGCGAEKFYNMVLRSARLFGMDMDALNSIWTEELALKCVDVYRDTNRAIRNAWYRLEDILDNHWHGNGGDTQWGPVKIGKGYVMGPNGLRMNYANPRLSGGEYIYDYGRYTQKLYGAKFLENIVQFLARINVMQDALRIADRTGHNFALQSHDELVWVVPEEEAERQLEVALEEMRRSPTWAVEIPLDAEGKTDDSYGACK